MSSTATTPAPRLGVIDIGSNTVHLLVMDARHGVRPVPHAERKITVRLMRYLDADGALSAEGERAMLAAVDDVLDVARESAVEELLPMATSALRDAANGAAVLAEISRRVGRDVQVLSGEDEARLTFLAARRWHGWAAGRLLVLDIGGGSLEIASGVDEEPDLAASVPLGAGRTTRAFLPDDPPGPDEVEALRVHCRTLLAPVVERLAAVPAPDHVVATSKTFRSLARLAGMQLEVVGPDERWRMRLSQLADWVPRLARIPAEGRTALPGVTPERTYQIVGGAVVAEETMRALGVDEVEICPWALREGAVLQRLDRL
ncbi:Ppx/GppA phosphatase family protein [Krasilnikoviella flava]|uniref:Exopolyphosphatase / guanosine-5'-triphosphate,3'-diphosphate pyrophosphatase n=1 Tax=Krasilnikoviella flava TaxID=526729 RepID=A0A1T5JZ27_9MICO|nr:exopolyphosphatase [Krasilnikoviella flava]SKC56498.1 exopolyphosphatase / guanosine-5'-triphosphate,3'-diphosphate pyrophosphatase [Krasilnikoviella flava]